MTVPGGRALTVITRLTERPGGCSAAAAVLWEDVEVFVDGLGNPLKAGGQARGGQQLPRAQGLSGTGLGSFL